LDASTEPGWQLAAKMNLQILVGKKQEFAQPDPFADPIVRDNPITI
jgi:hypothetical protein